MLAAIALALALGGASPTGGVVDGGDAMYGATAVGGSPCTTGAPRDSASFGCGLIFRLAYDGSTYTVIHRFAGSDGAYPVGPLLLGADGRLYGRTLRGGKYGDGVVFSLDARSRQFRTVYDYDGSMYGDVPALAGGASGAIYAVSHEPHALATIVRIAGGSVLDLASFQAETKIVDLQTSGRFLYALLDRPNRCGSEIERLGENGSIEVLLADSSDVGFHLCSSATEYTKLLPDASGAVYALNPDGVDRVAFGVASPYYRIPENSANKVGVSRGLAKGLSPGPSGRLLVTLSAASEFNCGVVLSLDRSGRARTEAIVPIDRRISTLPCFSSQEPWLTLARTGDFYVTTPSISCNAPTPSMNSSCGSISVLRRTGGFDLLYAFGQRSRYDSSATRMPQSFRDVLQTTTDPHRWLLIRPSADGAATTAQTPEPRAVALRSVTTGAIAPLERLQGATTAHWLSNPFGPSIPALGYSMPAVGADMYDAGIPINGLWSSRVYFSSVGARPMLRIGQKFLALTYPDSQIDEMTDRNGTPLGASPVTLASRSNRMLEFRVDASGEDLQIPETDRTDQNIPGLTPIVQDVVTATLRERYVGRTVYPRQLAGTCVQSNGDTIGMSVRGTLRVRAIYRLYGVAPVLSIDASGADSASFTAVDPLAIVFDRPMHDSMAFASGKSSSMTDRPSDCFEYYAFAADPWHLERMIWLHPASDPRWPAPYRQGVAKGTVLIGMTREMVAAAIGYPPIYGTSEDFEKLDDWKYDRPAPMQAEVFFKNGRVVRYAPHGSPP